MVAIDDICCIYIKFANTKNSFSCAVFFLFIYLFLFITFQLLRSSEIDHTKQI